MIDTNRRKKETGNGEAGSQKRLNQVKSSKEESPTANSRDQFKYRGRDHPLQRRQKPQQEMGETQ